MFNENLLACADGFKKKRIKTVDSEKLRGDIKHINPKIKKIISELG